MVDVNLGEAFVDIRASLKKLDKDMQKARVLMSKRLLDISKDMGDIGRELRNKVTLPLTIGLTAAAVAGAKFQTQISRVGAISGASAKQLKVLSDQAKELGRTTEFSASQAADAQRFLAQAGFDVNEIFAALPGTLKLAIAGSLDLARAADIASNVLTAFGLEAGRINEVNEQLAAAATNSNTNIDQLAESLKFVGPAAKALGIPLSRVLATIGKLGDAGIQASEAGTALARAFINLANPTNQQEEAMDRLGVELRDSENNMRNLEDIVADIERTLERGANATDVAGDIFEAFGQRGGRAIAALVGRSKELREFNELIATSEGRVDRLASQALGPLERSFVELKSALESVGIAITEAGLGDFLVSIMNSIAGFLRAIATADAALLKFGLVLAGLFAVAGPVAIATSSILKFAAAFALLGTLGPIGGAVLALTALAGVIALVGSTSVKQIDPLKNLKEEVKKLDDATGDLTETQKVQAQVALRSTIAQRAKLGVELAGMRADLEKLKQKRDQVAESFNRQFPDAQLPSLIGDANVGQIGQLELAINNATQAMLDMDNAVLDAQERYKELGILVEATGDKIKVGTAAAGEETKGLSQELKDLAEEIKENVKTEGEKYGELLVKLGILLKAGEIDQKQFNLAVKQAGEEFGLSTDEGSAYVDVLQEARKREMGANAAAGEHLKTLQEQAKQLKEELKPAWQEFSEQVKFLDEVYANGLITIGEYNKALDQAKDKLKEQDEHTKRAKEAVRDLGLTFESAFEDAIFSGERLSDVLNALLQDILRIIVRKTVIEPLIGGLFGVLGFAKGGVISGSGKIMQMAKGGILNGPTLLAGGAAIGGEAGPEGVLPLERMAGGDLGVQASGFGGGGDVIINVHNAPEGTSVEEAPIAGGGRKIDVIIGEVAAENIRSGGVLSRAIREQFGLGNNVTKRG